MGYFGVDMLQAAEPACGSSSGPSVIINLVTENHSVNKSRTDPIVGGRFYSRTIIVQNTFLAGTK